MQIDAKFDMHVMLLVSIFCLALSSLTDTLVLPVVLNLSSDTMLPVSSVASTQYLNVPDARPPLRGASSLRICASPPEWFLVGVDRDDCSSAVDYLYIEEMHVTPVTQSFEFLPVGMKKKTKYLAKRVPRKYTFSKMGPR